LKLSLNIYLAIRKAICAPIEAPVQLEIVPIRVPIRLLSVACEKANPDPMVSNSAGMKHIVAMI